MALHFGEINHHSDGYLRSSMKIVFASLKKDYLKKKDLRQDRKKPTVKRRLIFLFGYFDKYNFFCRFGI